MAITQNWTAAVAGQGANAGMINQFLGSHSASFLRSGGTIQSQNNIGNAVYQSTATQWLSQIFAMGASQSTIGGVNIQLSAVGGSPINQTINPLTVQIYADAGGLPTGSPLATVTINETVVYSAPFWLTVPLVLTGLTPNAFYHVAVEMVGNGTNYYAWQESTPTFGAATSPDGVNWTLASYSLMFQVTDLTGTGQLQYIIEDNGARTLQLSYNSQGLLSQIVEYTVGQTTLGNLQNTRSLTYTNGFLTGVS